MVTIRKKNIISSKSLGEELEAARRLFNLSLLAVEKKIGLDIRYLQALENNEYELIPGEIYVRNFLKKYAEFLGFNWDKVKNRYEQEAKYKKLKSENEKSRFGLSQKKFIVFTKITKNIIFVLIVALIILYLSYNLWSLLRPPKLSILYPADNSTLGSQFVKILGKAEPESKLSLNDQDIFVAEDGFFRVDINLNKGLNVIKLEASKRYGRTNTQYINLIAP